jgi:hypothetical protein
VQPAAPSAEVHNCAVAGRLGRGSRDTIIIIFIFFGFQNRKTIQKQNTGSPVTAIHRAPDGIATHCFASAWRATSKIEAGDLVNKVVLPARVTRQNWKRDQPILTYW